MIQKQFSDCKELLKFSCNWICGYEVQKVEARCGAAPQSWLEAQLDWLCRRLLRNLSRPTIWLHHCGEWWGENVMLSHDIDRWFCNLTVTPIKPVTYSTHHLTELKLHWNFERRNHAMACINVTRSPPKHIAQLLDSPQHCVEKQSRNAPQQYLKITFLINVNF